MAKTGEGLVAYALAQVGRPYWLGAFGHQATEDFYQRTKAQHHVDYADYKSQLGQKVHDCCGLIKGYCWTDDANAFFKSGQYQINGCGDWNAEMMWGRCSERGDISTIPKVPGILVFTKDLGHVGVYDGKEYVIEARGHAFGVQKNKLSARSFVKWGKLSCCITYSAALTPKPEPKPEPPKPAKNAGVMSFQSWINRFLPMGYLKEKLVVDGEYGPKTRKAAIKCLQYWLNMQYAAGLSVDGGFGPLTKRTCKVLRKGSSGNGVYILQGLLYCHGYDPKGFDGSFGVNGGTGCLNAVKDFQRDHGLEVDGEAGRLTFEKLCE